MSKQDEFLKSQKVLRLATIGKRLHIVPVWYIYMAKKIYIGTNTGTRKARNVMENRDVSFCVDVGVNSPDIYGVMGQGDASLILEEKKVKKIAKKILLRYFDSLENKSARELLDDTNCIIEIVPERIAVWEY